MACSGHKVHPLGLIPIVKAVQKDFGEGLVGVDIDQGIVVNDTTLAVIDRELINLLDNKTLKDVRNLNMPHDPFVMHMMQGTLVSGHENGAVWLSEPEDTYEKQLSSMALLTAGFLQKCRNVENNDIQVPNVNDPAFESIKNVIDSLDLKDQELFQEHNLYRTN